MSKYKKIYFPHTAQFLGKEEFQNNPLFQSFIHTIKEKGFFESELIRTVERHGKKYKICAIKPKRTDSSRMIYIHIDDFYFILNFSQKHDSVFDNRNGSLDRSSLKSEIDEAHFALERFIEENRVRIEALIDSAERQIALEKKTQQIETEEFDYEVKEMIQDGVMKFFCLSSDQQRLRESCLAHLNQSSRMLINIDALAGCGKTTTGLTVLFDLLKAQYHQRRNQEGPHPLLRVGFVCPGAEVVQKAIKSFQQLELADQLQEYNIDVVFRHLQPHENLQNMRQPIYRRKQILDWIQNWLKNWSKTHDNIESSLQPIQLYTHLINMHSQYELILGQAQSYQDSFHIPLKKNDLQILNDLYQAFSKKIQHTGCEGLSYDWGPLANGQNFHFLVIDEAHNLTEYALSYLTDQSQHVAYLSHQDQAFRWADIGHMDFFERVHYLKNPHASAIQKYSLGQQLRNAEEIHQLSLKLLNMIHLGKSKQKAHALLNSDQISQNLLPSGDLRFFSHYREATQIEALKSFFQEASANSVLLVQPEDYDQTCAQFPHQVVLVDHESQGSEYPLVIISGVNWKALETLPLEDWRNLCAGRPVDFAKKAPLALQELQRIMTLVTRATQACWVCWESPFLNPKKNQMKISPVDLEIQKFLKQISHQMIDAPCTLDLGGRQIEDWQHLIGQLIASQHLERAREIYLKHLQPLLPSPISFSKYFSQELAICGEESQSTSSSPVPEMSVKTSQSTTPSQASSPLPDDAIVDRKQAISPDSLLRQKKLMEENCKRIQSWFSKFNIETQTEISQLKLKKIDTKQLTQELQKLTNPETLHLFLFHPAHADKSDSLMNLAKKQHPQAQYVVRKISENNKILEKIQYEFLSKPIEFPHEQYASTFLKIWTESLEDPEVMKLYASLLLSSKKNYLQSYFEKITSDRLHKTILDELWERPQFSQLLSLYNVKYVPSETSLNFDHVSWNKNLISSYQTLLKSILPESELEDPNSVWISQYVEKLFEPLNRLLLAQSYSKIAQIFQIFDGMNPKYLDYAAVVIKHLIEKNQLVEKILDHTELWDVLTQRVFHHKPDLLLCSCRDDDALRTQTFVRKAFETPNLRASQLKWLISGLSHDSFQYDFLHLAFRYFDREVFNSFAQKVQSLFGDCDKTMLEILSTRDSENKTIFDLLDEQTQQEFNKDETSEKLKIQNQKYQQMKREVDAITERISSGARGNFVIEIPKELVHSQPEIALIRSKVEILVKSSIVKPKLFIELENLQYLGFLMIVLSMPQERRSWLTAFENLKSRMSISQHLMLRTIVSSLIAMRQYEVARECCELFQSAYWYRVEKVEMIEHFLLMMALRDDQIPYETFAFLVQHAKKLLSEQDFLKYLNHSISYNHHQINLWTYGINQQKPRYELLYMLAQAGCDWTLSVDCEETDRYGFFFRIIEENKKEPHSYGGVFLLRIIELFRSQNPDRFSWLLNIKNREGMNLAQALWNSNVEVVRKIPEIIENLTSHQEFLYQLFLMENPTQAMAEKCLQLLTDSLHKNKFPELFQSHSIENQIQIIMLSLYHYGSLLDAQIPLLLINQLDRDRVLRNGDVHLGLLVAALISVRNDELIHTLLGWMIRPQDVDPSVMDRVWNLISAQSKKSKKMVHLNLRSLVSLPSYEGFGAELACVSGQEIPVIGIAIAMDQPIEIIKKMIELDALKGVLYTSGGVSVLHMAILKKRVDVISLLLEALSHNFDEIYDQVDDRHQTAFKVIPKLYELPEIREDIHSVIISALPELTEQDVYLILKNKDLKTLSQCFKRFIAVDSLCWTQVIETSSQDHTTLLEMLIELSSEMPDARVLVQTVLNSLSYSRLHTLQIQFHGSLLALLAKNDCIASFEFVLRTLIDHEIDLLALFKRVDSQGRDLMRVLKEKGNQRCLGILNHTLAEQGISINQKSEFSCCDLPISENLKKKSIVLFTSPAGLEEERQRILSRSHQ